MKTLVIAEKPSVARDIASALGKIKKQDNWYENDAYIVTSAVGHLVELFMPEDMDKKLRYWRLDPLPIIPKDFKLKPIEKNKSKFNELKKLIKRKDVDNIVNACDAGREGELIFTYICELADNKKPVKRLWLQSMTSDAIRKAFHNLREGQDMAPLRDAARCRSEADWLIGINGTRAITTRMYGTRKRSQIATVGRVQTPTLTLVLEREKLIKNFQPRDYWRIRGTFGLTEGNYEGLYQRADFKKSEDEHDKPDRIWDQAQAEAILETIRKESHALVEERKKRRDQIAPRFYDLTTLQREANNRFGLPAGVTLSVAQSLYEKHKLITYPRTDCRALPEDYLPTVKDVMGKLEGDEYEKYAERALENGYVRMTKRNFNNSEVSDHFAIIPTGANMKKLNANESKIYDMITRRFIAAFYPPAKFDVTTRLSNILDHIFKTEGKVLVEPGWLDVYGKGNTGKDSLPPITANDGEPPKAQVIDLSMEEDATKPPPRYTEATLLSAMESAGKFVDDDELAEAMKEKGLGTPATRAQIIDHLVQSKYIERENRELIPSAKAENLVEFLNAVHAEEITSPSLTGEWEFKLREIENGRLSRDKFMQGIAEMTSDLVKKTKDFQESDTESRATSIISPSDGKPLMETLRTYSSQDGEYTIYKVVGNRKLEEPEVKELLEKGTIGPLDGFRSRFGKPFSAMLRLNQETKKVEFVFENSNGDGENGKDEDLSQFPVIGECPKCKGKVHEASSAYICEHNSGENRKCDFRLSRNLLGKTIPSEEAKKMLTEGKSGLIEGFRSKKNKRLFSAFLLLTKNGALRFEFPPRAAKKTTTKKTAAKKTAAKKAASGQSTVSQ